MFTRFKNVILAVQYKIYAVALSLISTSTFALDKLDLTDDLSGGKTLEDIAENANDSFGWGMTLFLAGCTATGIIICGASLYKLKKAGEEGSREGYGGPIFGLVIGGFMTAVGVLTFAVKGTFFN